MNSISLGQYYPAASPVHRLDARMKVIIAILYVVCTFLCKNILSFALLLVMAVATIILSRLPFGMVMRSIRPILVIIGITSLINIFWSRGEVLLVDWWIFKIYLEGVYNALLLVVRFVTLIIGTSVFLTYTTTPIALTDAIERLTSPLKKLGVPTHEFAMMMTIALRFIPTLIEETDKIISAQKSRGADFETGSLLKRAKAIVPILIPLFISAFRRADELASAMECRLYHGGEGRTKMKILKLHAYDFAALLFFVAVIAVTLLINKFLYI
jgi:energy-coupling factor transport system permease protein